LALSSRLLDTLANLSRKKAGADVGWVAIAEARELDAMGLAVRTRSGWEITASGEAALGQEGDATHTDPPSQLLQFPPPDHPANR
jgi:hypothetical protein